MDDFLYDNIENIEYKFLVLYNLYKRAEQDDNEQLYNSYENLFQKVKQYVQSDTNLSITIKFLFNDFNSASLDNLFSSYIVEKKTITKLDAGLLKKGYVQFYDIFTKFYNRYKEVEKNYEQDVVDSMEKEFEDFKQQVAENEEYFNLIKENSQIKSKLQLKLANYNLF